VQAVQKLFDHTTYISLHSQSAEVALYSLIHALNDEGLVAIARKVYRVNTAPVLGALFPRVSSKYEVRFLEVFSS
jgi:hypothetical protein